MTNEIFSNLYNGFYGEDIDRPEQLTKIVFTGVELKEFMEYLQKRFLLGSAKPPESTKGEDAPSEQDELWEEVLLIATKNNSNDFFKKIKQSFTISRKK